MRGPWEKVGPTQPRTLVWGAPCSRCSCRRKKKKKKRRKNKNKNTIKHYLKAPVKSKQKARVGVGEEERVGEFCGDDNKKREGWGWGAWHMGLGTKL